MYSILLLEDAVKDRAFLKEELESHQFKVFSCRDLYEAIDTWKNHKDELDAIILDLMMTTSGIKRVYRNLANCGLLSGWIWLWHVLNPHEEDPHPAADKSIIIYAAYLNELEDYINSDKASDKEKEFAKSVKLFNKDSYGENVKKIVKLLIEDRDRKEGRNER